MTPSNSPWARIALVALALAQGALLLLSAFDLAVARELFVHTTYYFLSVTVLCWAGTYLHSVRGFGWESALGWAKQNWPGLVVASCVTATAALAVEPALRVLSDEANLVGTSKNLFASKTATFTVSGKYYYGSYWDVDVAIDRRPTLFPFLVSLVHAVRGYSHENAFLLNLLVLPAFVLVAYRLAKSLVGETFAVVAALLVASHPITLISVRSGGFDFLATFFALLVVKSLLDFVRDAHPAKLAWLWMNLCMFAEVRYESALFIPPVVGLLLLFRMVPLAALRPHALLYVLTPAYLLPRIWQAMLKGNVPEQEPGAVTFSFENFARNTLEYLEPFSSPFAAHHVHSVLLIALGIVGGLACLGVMVRRSRERDFRGPEFRFSVFVVTLLAVQIVIVFSYVWGRAQAPSAARLVLPLDTFFSFTAAWLLTLLLARFKQAIAVAVAAAVFLSQVPVAAQHRSLNRLTQTRESATTWRFFERLNERRILIVTDRPNHFTIMNYGAMNFETARNDRYLFTALERRLFQDVYVIQQIRLSTNEPLPGYELWPDRKLETVFEFQNDADVLVRISRVPR